MSPGETAADALAAFTGQLSELRAYLANNTGPVDKDVVLRSLDAQIRANRALGELLRAGDSLRDVDTPEGR